ncbi:OmpA family protein [Solitalea koreensis]|uniref:Outer membrane protein OmpA n=1 Tax=Solitalea koreensis TaxID=543615 RepID=A0A521D872_9SPHI|nr:OmpA family protein [Solitalea koreensis]SMO67893.1 Outer membrane protein OmpA [Solitalea koreensis]
MKRTLYSILFSLALFPIFANAQYVNDYQKLGDKFFAEGNYYAASQLYAKLLNTSEQDKTQNLRITPYRVQTSSLPKNNAKNQIILTYKLAESLRLYNNYMDAEKWYEVVVSSNMDKNFPYARLWYGVTLRANQKFVEAFKQFKQFLKEYNKQDAMSDLAKFDLYCCEFAIKEMSEPHKDIVTKLESKANIGDGNWATVIADSNQVYFTSSRLLIKDKKGVPVNYNTVYKGKLNGLEIEAPAKVDIPISEGKQQGVIAFSPNKKTMYLTRWKQNKSQSFEAAIYVSSYENGKWSDPTILPNTINYPGSRNMYPFITSSGKGLFFVSDRPGGYGKTDIWYSEISASGLFSEPINLGPKINTKENEQAPFYDERSQKLIYSSNGKFGLGGLDLYEAKGALDSWTEPENLGYPMNSSKDETNFTPITADLKKGFISSDRQSVCCLELFSFERDNIHFVVEGSVADCDSRLPLAGARVILTDSTSVKLNEVVLGPDGRYVFDLYSDKPTYKIMISKGQYFSVNYEFKWDKVIRRDTMLNPEICLKKYEIGKPIVIPNIYYDYDKATLRQESKVVLDSLLSVLQANPNLVVELSSHTDSRGSDSYNEKLSEKRAQSCVNYLISKGISSQVIIPKGYGKSCPIAQNTINGKDNPQGRQLNRRTEFRVLRIIEQDSAFKIP